MTREVTFRVHMFNYHKRIRADILGVTGNGVVIGAHELSNRLRPNDRIITVSQDNGVAEP